MKKIFFSFLLLAYITALPSSAQTLDTYVAKERISGGDTLRYRILYPIDFNPNEKYPLILVLHGSGERGSDNEAQLTHGARLFLKEDVRKDFPAIVVFPQCAAGSFWSSVKFGADAANNRIFNFQTSGGPTKALEMVIELVKDLRAEKYVDSRRIYAGGLSMGGMGTFELLRHRPRYFAAAFPICGGDNVANVRKYRKTPLWIFHGAKDPVVPPQLSQAIADELQKRKAKEVKFTLYPDANHNSWDPAFAEPQLLPWLFSHRR